MILDCTFRDGGYYVNWDFEDKLIQKYISSLIKANVDIIELGFRFLPNNKFYGAFAHTTDEYIKTLSIPKKTKIAVMVNASDLINFSDGISKAVKKLFKKKDNSPVSIVRIAVHVKDIRKSKEIAKQIKLLGYKICLNIMQVDKLKSDEISNISSQIEKWKSIDILYFADSFGNMSPKDVKNTILSIKKGWSGKVGFHAHDNKGQAITNCLTAIDNHIDIIDSTVLGMGRGAGNAKTESLLVELTNKNLGNYFAEALFPLVMQEFKTLQDKYEWGTNIYYYLSAIYGIHPTYIQEMISDERYGSENILSSINFLKLNNSSSFSFDNLNRANSGIIGNEKGSWSSKNWCRNKTVLIICSGPSTQKYKNEIIKFILKQKPFVLCLNINENIPSKLINAYVACNDTRILIESDAYSKLRKPLVLPLSRLPKNIKSSLKKIKIFDYGLKLKNNSFSFFDSGCLLDKPLALPYAICAVTAGGAKNILLTGVDGYNFSDSRHLEISEMFIKYSKCKSSLNISAITPTNYPIKQSSLFDPNFNL